MSQIPEKCPLCDVPPDDHLVSDLRAHPATVYDHHLPFEEYPQEQHHTIDRTSIAGSIAVKAGAMNVGVTVHPVLIFEFGGNDQHTFAPVALVLDDYAMRKVRTIVGSAIDAALKGARRNRR